MKPRRKIVFATNNLHKLEEINRIMGDDYEIVGLKDIGCNEDIPETADSLTGNARQKAMYVKEHYGFDCFADDTGLFVEALGGEPGIRSARYAGDGHDSAANMKKLLQNMQGKQNRDAYFMTVIAFVEGDDVTFHQGRVDGFIEESPRGTDGFGYDPVFRPSGFDMTFAMMSGDEKNTISHRGRAVQAFTEYLKTR